MTKKIIFLLPILGGGGGERVVSDLSFYFPRNIEKIIVAFETKNYYRYNGKIISLSIKLSTNPISKLFIFLKGYFEFRKIIAEEKPDYVISFGSLQNVINVLGAKNSILRIDNPISISHKGLFEKFYPFFVKFFFNKTKKIIVVSKGLKKELVKNFNIKEEKIEVIYNSIDIDKAKKLSTEPLEAELQKIFSHQVIINIGSLIGQKGQGHLIKAFKEVKKEINDIKLVILGEGVLEQDLRKMAKDLNLENDVYFLGWQKNPFKFLARSKLFVLSSLWEGFGIVLLEAMACNLPVIASDCSFGPREILAPDIDLNYKINKIEYTKYGVLFPALKTDCLKEAIIKVLKDDNLQKSMIRNARERVQDFEVKNIIKQWDFLVD